MCGCVLIVLGILAVPFLGIEPLALVILGILVLIFDN